MDNRTRVVRPTSTQSRRETRMPRNEDYYDEDYEDSPRSSSRPRTSMRDEAPLSEREIRLIIRDEINNVLRDTLKEYVNRDEMKSFTETVLKNLKGRVQESEEDDEEDEDDGFIDDGFDLSASNDPMDNAIEEAFGIRPEERKERAKKAQFVEKEIRQKPMDERWRAISNELAEPDGSDDWDMSDVI